MNDNPKLKINGDIELPQETLYHNLHFSWSVHNLSKLKLFSSFERKDTDINFENYIKKQK